MMGPLIPLSSSNLAGASYDPETQKMLVKFTNNMQYEYDGVPQDEFDGLCSASSPGSYLHENIKGAYQNRKK